MPNFFKSSSVSNRLPRYLHLFLSVCPFPLMVYSSVFCFVYFQVLLLSCAGILFLIFSVLCVAFTATWPVSSAYC